MTEASQQNTDSVFLDGFVINDSENKQLFIKSPGNVLNENE